MIGPDFKEIFYEETVGDLLADMRAQRQRMGYTIEQVEIMMGVTKDLVGKWERGDRIPHLFSFFVWARAIGYDVGVKPRASDYTY